MDIITEIAGAFHEKARRHGIAVEDKPFHELREEHREALQSTVEDLVREKLITPEWW